MSFKTAKNLRQSSLSSKYDISYKNKAGYTATPVVCLWAGAVLERVTRAFGQELWAQQVTQGQYAVSDIKALLCMIVNWSGRKQGSSPEGDIAL